MSSVEFICRFKMGILMLLGVIILPSARENFFIVDNILAIYFLLVLEWVIMWPLVAESWGLMFRAKARGCDGKSC